MKRQNVKICETYAEAWDLAGVLQKAGVRAKIVTKHAVQIDPRDVDLATAALIAEEQKRKDTPWPSAKPDREDVMQGPDAPPTLEQIRSQEGM